MTRVGITGHVDLAPDMVCAITAALRRILAQTSAPLIGVTCLARGADQLFARQVLDLGGQIEVILPAADYRDRKVNADNLAEFDELIARAAQIRVMPRERSDRAAYQAASEAMLANVEEMIAVWDGRPSDAPGGTGDVVRSARERSLPVTVVWPGGASCQRCRV
jgi:hypothetical protein